MAAMITPGRPLEFDPEEALEAAMHVFWQKGYEAASITDLLTAMALSKSSLYQTFGNKQQLFERCLNRYGNWLYANMANQMAAADTGYQFIESVLYSIADTAQLPVGARGCLMVNSTIEFGQTNPIIASAIAENLGLFSDLYLEAVQRAQQEGDIPADADAVAIVNYLHIAISGLRTMIKGGADRNSVQATISLILKAIR